MHGLNIGSTFRVCVAVSMQVNVMMGVGLLSLPFALKSSGWVGLVLLWLMGIVTNYTGKQSSTARVMCVCRPACNVQSALQVCVPFPWCAHIMHLTALMLAGGLAR